MDVHRALAVRFRLATLHAPHCKPVKQRRPLIRFRLLLSVITTRSHSFNHEVNNNPRSFPCQCGHRAVISERLFDDASVYSRCCLSCSCLLCHICSSVLCYSSSFSVLGLLLRDALLVIYGRRLYELGLWLRLLKTV